FRSDLLYGVDDVAVGLLELVVQSPGDLVGTAAFGGGLLGAGTGQPAAGERAPRDDADADVPAQRDHLPLLFAVQQVVVVLHGHERGPLVQPRDVARLGELPGVHAGRADVAGFSGAYDVLQRTHRLLDGGVVVPAVDLVQVDVVGTEPAQRVVDGTEDVLARQALVVRAVPGRPVHLGRQHVVVATREQFAEQPPGDLFADAARVRVGCVEECDSLLDGAPDDGFALV